MSNINTDALNEAITGFEKEVKNLEKISAICESIQAASDSFELTTKAFDATNSDIQKITNELILSLSALQRSSASLQESFTDSDKENKAANAELIKKLISIGEDQDKSSKLMDEKANEISQSTKKFPMILKIQKKR